MKKIFGLALIATLLAPMACTKSAEEVPATEEVAPTEDAAVPTEQAPADTGTETPSH